MLHSEVVSINFDLSEKWNDKSKRSTINLFKIVNIFRVAESRKMRRYSEIRGTHSFRQIFICQSLKLFKYSHPNCHICTEI